MKDDEKNVFAGDEIRQLLVDSLHVQQEMFMSLSKLFLAMIVGFTIIICTGIVGFFIYESQFDTITDGTEITTEGENSDASLIKGNQYNDSASHTEQGGE